MNLGFVLVQYLYTVEQLSSTCYKPLYPKARKLIDSRVALLYIDCSPL